MKKKSVFKKIALFLVLIMCFSVLSACGGNEEKEEVSKEEQFLKDILGEHEFGETSNQFESRKSPYDIVDYRIIDSDYWVGEDNKLYCIEYLLDTDERYDPDSTYGCYGFRDEDGDYVRNDDDKAFLSRNMYKYYSVKKEISKVFGDGEELDFSEAYNGANNGIKSEWYSDSLYIGLKLGYGEFSLSIMDDKYE